ncbi:unnamed protein product [Ectocarpus sp. 6 AP-2014]
MSSLGRGSARRVHICRCSLRAVYSNENRRAPALYNVACTTRDNTAASAVMYRRTHTPIHRIFGFSARGCVRDFDITQECWPRAKKTNSHRDFLPDPWIVALRFGFAKIKNGCAVRNYISGCLFAYCTYRPRDVGTCAVKKERARGGMGTADTRARWWECKDLLAQRKAIKLCSLQSYCHCCCCCCCWLLLRCCCLL